MIARICNSFTMAFLDLKDTQELTLRIIAGRPWAFQLRSLSVGIDISAVTVAMHIRARVDQNLSYGTGVVYVAPDKMVFRGAALPPGVFDYSLQITLADGRIMKLSDKIISV